MSAQKSRWLQQPISEIVHLRKNRHPDWADASTLLKALQPTLAKVNEIYLSEVESCLFFLVLSQEVPVTDEKKTEETSITWRLRLVEPVERTEEQPTDELKDPVYQMGEGYTLFSRYETVDVVETMDIITTFMCDFPDACFSMVGGFPLLIRGERFPDRFVTLNNFKNALSRQVTKFAIMMPRGKQV